MITYTSGNILEADTQSIVNTVNCEGYMGKGIAYQFKVKFPENNKEYENLCKSNRFHVGDILMFEEGGKVIMNFPTKDKWRKPSEYLFIEKGLGKLRQLIVEHDISSIAIPPLGCGNGGLNWGKVRGLIEDSFKGLEDDVDIVVYQPLFSGNADFKNQITKVPSLSSSHLLLMKFKLSLTQFSKIRLQKAAFLNNIIAGQDYFKFKSHNFGPYAHSIDVLSRDIKEYQDYYKIDTQNAYEKLYETLISKNVISKISGFLQAFEKTVRLVNKIQTDLELELLASVLFLIKTNKAYGLDEIISSLHDWNEHKKNNFSSDMILGAVLKLVKLNLISETLYQTYEIVEQVY